MGRCQHTWRILMVWDSQIFSYYFFTYLKDLISLAWGLKILKDPLEEDPPNVTPEIIPFSDFIFFFVFTYFGSFMSLAWMVEKFELKKKKTFRCPKFYLSFIFIYSKNFISLASMVKVLILASLLEENHFSLVPPNFVKFYLFFIFVYSEIFMCLAWVVKKFEFWWPRLRGAPSFCNP